MKSKKYKAFAMALTVCMMIGALGVPGFALQPNDEVIAFEEYNAALSAEYAKYGVGFEITEYNPNYTFTRSALNEAIAGVEADVNSIQVVVHPTVMPTSAGVAEEDFKYSFSWSVIKLLCSADFVTQIEGQIDLVGDKLMRVTKFQHVLSSGLNYTSHNITNSQWRDMGSAEISWSVEGYVLFEYTEPTTGMKLTYNVPFDISRTFDTMDYRV